MIKKSNIKAVCDAGPLIHLDELDCLDLLNDFEETLTPEAVSKEVGIHRPKCMKNPALKCKVVKQQLSASPALSATCRAFALDLGEAEALALVEVTPGAIFLTDDAAARLVAMQMGFRVHGTIGILLRAVRRQLRTAEEILNILEEMPTRSTLYVKRDLLEQVMRRLKDEFKQKQ